MENILPSELLNDLEGITGFDRESFQAVHADQESITSIRFNIEKINHYSSFKFIESAFNIKAQIPWCANAFYLRERPSFILDPLLHAGVYYVQEASSMFLHEVLKQTCSDAVGNKVLDLCAAPGGKSSLLSSFFKQGLVICNEVIKQRVNILYENLTKWGAENVVITNNDASDFKELKNYFHVIVVDAPCSGSGLFRKDADAIKQWSTKNVALCNQRQQRIIANVYSSLKQDGILIYSTCSYSKEENENISDWIKDSFNVSSIELKLKDEWNVAQTRSAKHKAFGYRFWPDKVKGEGFFIAVFRKNDDSSDGQISKKVLNKIANAEATIAFDFINETHNWFLFKQKENIRVVSKEWMNDIALLQQNLYLRKAGINVGTIKNHALIPHHELALSSIIKNDLQKAALTRDEALQYLRKKEIRMDNKIKGWALSTYKNFPLGWIKFLHTRVNNYYPTEWRILKD